MDTASPNALEPYCLRCHAQVLEAAAICGSCGTSFAGAGSFQRVRAPRPSLLWFKLFGPPAEGGS
ncbi:hypothetical protein MK489_13725 [Myxococcota bacterium]|nr:hypothetical protein [Myxococcota bacterium]